MEEKTDYRGLEDLLSGSPGQKRTYPKEVVEKETVMSKLRGSVNVPEEFKFADDTTSTLC